MTEAPAWFVRFDDAIDQLAQLQHDVEQYVPKSREFSLFLTKLDEAGLWGVHLLQKAYDKEN